MPTAQQVVNRYLVAMAIKTRFIGTCATCWQNVRCPNGTLAHHGYKRPGWGSIHGSCLGTAHEPWEVSPITGKIALDYFTQRTEILQKQLKALPNATQLTPLWGREPKPLIKAEAKPYEWQNLYETIERNLQRDLKASSELKEEYENKVREWQPSKVTTLEEDEAAKREKAETGRKVRMDRYTVNRDKTIDRFKKTFAKIQRSEQVLKSAREAKPIAKALHDAFTGARTIYDTFYSKPGQLQQSHPLHSSRGEIIADWGIDDILQHMGLIQGGEYVLGKVAWDMSRDANMGTEPYPSEGLDARVPFWPGWNGTIHYPEGTTGKDLNRRDW